MNMYGYVYEYVYLLIRHVNAFNLNYITNVYINRAAMNNVSNIRQYFILGVGLSEFHFGHAFTHAFRVHLLHKTV